MEKTTNAPSDATGQRVNLATTDVISAKEMNLSVAATGERGAATIKRTQIPVTEVRTHQRLR